MREFASVEMAQSRVAKRDGARGRCRRSMWCEPNSGAAAQEIVLPGTTQAFIDTPIYARTNGYLKQWYVDIGAHVQQGQLLAEIETPEMDQQLDQARPNSKTAQANEQLAADHRGPLAESAQNRQRIEAGDRPGGQRSERDASDRGVDDGQRSPFGAIAVLREGLRSFFRRDHGEKYGHRRTH